MFNFYQDNQVNEHNTDLNINWKNKLEKISEYIDNYNKLPSRYDENSDINELGYWLDNQKKNYLDNNYIMNDLEIKKEWETFVEKYAEYFSNNLNYPAASQNDLEIMYDYFTFWNKYSDEQEEYFEHTKRKYFFHWLDNSKNCNKFMSWDKINKFLNIKNKQFYYNITLFLLIIINLLICVDFYNINNTKIEQSIYDLEEYNRFKFYSFTKKIDKFNFHMNDKINSLEKQINKYSTGLHKITSLERRIDHFGNFNSELNQLKNELFKCELNNKP